MGVIQDLRGKLQRGRKKVGFVMAEVSRSSIQNLDLPDQKPFQYILFIKCIHSKQVAKVPEFTVQNNNAHAHAHAFAKTWQELGVVEPVRCRANNCSRSSLPPGLVKLQASRRKNDLQGTVES